MTALGKGLSAALIVLLAGVAYLGHQTEVTDLKRDLAASKASASTFSLEASAQSAGASSMVELQKKTALAHASETAALTNALKSLQSAKEKINAAPDAADHYRYSDGLYDLMQQHAEADSAHSGSTETSLDPG